MLRGVCVICTCGFRAVGIHSACMCVGYDIRSVMHELVHELITLTFLRSMRAGPQVHGFVLLVVVIDVTPFLAKCLVVLREIGTQRN